MADEPVEVTQHVDASPEVVFELLVNPDQFVKWQGVAASFDPTPGGKFWLDVTGGQVAAGEFIEIDPPHRLVFTWGWEGDHSPLRPGSTTVEVTLTPVANGTEVCLRHYGLPPSDRQHLDGHRQYLARLAELAAGNDPGPDPWVRG